ncbi:MAG: hypothetical protein HDKAJFGB_03270 [Anaerolineae bacterium]|nr:hypothetical protein [Anaerolineae bacterium]
MRQRRLRGGENIRCNGRRERQRRRQRAIGKGVGRQAGRQRELRGFSAQCYVHMLRRERCQRERHVARLRRWRKRFCAGNNFLRAQRKSQCLRRDDLVVQRAVRRHARRARIQRERFVCPQRVILIPARRRVFAARQQRVRIHAPRFRIVQGAIARRHIAAQRKLSQRVRRQTQRNFLRLCAVGQKNFRVARHMRRQFEQFQRVRVKKRGTRFEILFHRQGKGDAVQQEKCGDDRQRKDSEQLFYSRLALDARDVIGRPKRQT